MSQKPFHKLTKEEATKLARGCTLGVTGATPKDKIIRRLTEAGFCGDSISIDTFGDDPNVAPMVYVRAPDGEFITA